MNDRELTPRDKLIFSGIAYAVAALIFIVIPLLAISYKVGGTMPVFFIVAGLMAFLLPGLFNRDPDQSRNPFSAYAYRCYQLIQDEDPKMAGTVSLAKFQMLFWTIILATSFIWLLLKDQQAPEIPNVWLVLMGISNGTYVLAKWAKTVKESRVQPKTTEVK